MKECEFHADSHWLVIRPTARGLATGFSFAAVFCTLSVVYGLGAGVFMAGFAEASWWLTALTVITPIAFAFVLGSWFGDSREPFRFDREQGWLMDGARAAFPLTSIRGVAVQFVDPERRDRFIVDLVLEDGTEFALHRQWWPPETDYELIRERARQIAKFLGVECRLIGALEAAEARPDYEAALAVRE